MWHAPARPTLLLFIALIAWGCYTTPAFGNHSGEHPVVHSDPRLDYFFRLQPPITRQQGGQSALDAIQEVVASLLADPATDWSQVNIDRVQHHLADLDIVMLHTTVENRSIENGLEMKISGPVAVREALWRIVPPHVHAIGNFRQWRFQINGQDKSQGGPEDAPLKDPPPLILTVTSDDPAEREIIRALRFFGILASGVRHPDRLLAIALGKEGG